MTSHAGFSKSPDTTHSDGALTRPAHRRGLLAAAAFVLAAFGLGALLTVSPAGAATPAIPKPTATAGASLGLVVFSWPSTGAKTYDLAYNGTGLTSRVDLTKLTSTTVKVGGLKPGGTYQVKVRARYATTSSVWSPWKYITLPTTLTAVTTTTVAASPTNTVAPTTTAAPATAAPTTTAAAPTTTAAPATTAPATTIAPATTVATSPSPLAPLNVNLAAGKTSGWSTQLSGATETVANTGTALQCTAGGYSSFTHYARLKYKVAETAGVVVRGSFTMSVDFELPSDFYTKSESYLRFINTDNPAAVIKSSGLTAGALSADEWRVGFLMYNSDRLPRLQSDHENHERLTLWTGTSPLTVGRHSVTIKFTPSQTNAGSFEVWLDGVLVGSGSGVKTAPATLAPSEVAVTRVVTGIDGAAAQTSQPVTVLLHSASFTAPSASLATS